MNQNNAFCLDVPNMSSMLSNYKDDYAIRLALVKCKAACCGKILSSSIYEALVA